VTSRTLWDVALCSVWALLALLVSYTVADADLWGHLRFGADLLHSWRFTRHDPYSFTSDVAWINHEWLAEAVFAAVYSLSGTIGLNLLKVVTIGAIAALAWRRAHRLAATAFPAAIVTALLIVVTYTRTQSLRPQLFSVLFFAILLRLLERTERDGQLPFVAITLLFAVWANTHGGWIVGFGTLAIWCAWRPRRTPIAAVAAAATLINPYGVGLWRFLYSTVGLARPEISDWQPMFGLPRAIVGLELALPLLALVAIVKTRRAPSMDHVVIIAALAFGTLRIGRTDAFLQLAIAWLCGPAIIGWLNLVDARTQPTSPLLQPRLLYGYVTAAIVVGAIGCGISRLARIPIQGDWRPDADAIAFLRSHASHQRLLTWFDWGEYAIWHLSPAGVQVSMDGRRETVYSDRVLHDHFAFYGNASPDAWQYADAIGADAIWLPKRLPIVPALLKHGWHTELSTDMSVVLTKGSDTSEVSEHSGTGMSVASTSAALRAFP